jgi:hypothetical protein
MKAFNAKKAVMTEMMKEIIPIVVNNAVSAFFILQN